MRTSPRVLAASLLFASIAFASLGFAGCQSGGGDTTGLESGGFPAPDKALVYEAAMDAMRQQGFTPDSSSSSEAQGLVVSRHKLVLAPFSGQGYRDKATIRIKEVPNRPSYFTVEANVLREPNNNLTQPSNPIVADWGSAERVPEHENILASRVQMRFSAPGASDAFRKERGLGPAPGSKGGELGSGAAPGYVR